MVSVTQSYIGNEGNIRENTSVSLQSYRSKLRFKFGSRLVSTSSLHEIKINRFKNIK